MATRIDPTLMHELKAYGAVGIEKCFNCGNCTAICPLTSDDHPFPRNLIRYTQLGMKDRILESTDPWQCYYCGECTETCPKGAEPAETMMALRRWVTAKYDRSGHGEKLYTSEKAVWWTILRVSLLTMAFLILLHLLGLASIPTDRVALNEFAPVLWVWGFVILHFAYLGYRVFSNILNMSSHILANTRSEKQIPISVYLSEFKTFIVHYFTQRRWRDCNTEDRSRWLKHLLLVTGYVSMLVLIVPLLWWFQTDNIYPIYHPQRWIGYYATIVLIFTSGEAIIGRIRKKEELHKHSHPSDWMFPIFILVGAVTGILVHIFRYIGADYPVWAWPTYIIYIIHVMAMIAMLDTEVGIGKWMHMMYRPLAMYLERVKERAREIEVSAEVSPAAAD